MGRITFDLTNDPKTATAAVFPFRPGRFARRPQSEDRANGNFLEVAADADARFAARGSIPGVRLVALAPDRCDPGDKRFPAAGDFATDATRPSYACLDLDAAAGQPLALAFRQVKPPEAGADDPSRQRLAIEDGFLDRMPNRLTMTIATSPEGAAEFDVCAPESDGSAPDLPCRPPMISATAPHGDHVPEASRRA